MTYYVQTRWGGSERSPSAQRMREILAELDAHDDEHTGPWLEHESGWSVTADEGGRVVLDNAETSAPPRHMLDVSRERVLELWLLLAAGKIEEIERAAWLPGHGSAPFTDEDRAKLDAELLALEREFYDSLGSERDEPRCKAAQCSRGAVRASVFCRVHQYENATRKPCPFSH